MDGFNKKCRVVRLGLVLLAVGAVVYSALAGDTLSWNTTQQKVTADIKGSQLLGVLERIAKATHWQVFVEPETFHTVSVKFKDVPPGEALRLLLGDVNFALLPATNASPKLYVFRTARQNATQRIAPRKADHLIPNELIVRLKPGAKIDDLARLLGAKVVGRIDSLNGYRLQFDDAAATATAREQLAKNPAVDSVDSNFLVDRPDPPQSMPGNPAQLQLQLKPPPDTGRIIVGLIDTPVQPLGNDLDKFLLKQVSVAGDVQVGGDAPTHGTAMAETILRSLEANTKGSTSVQILPVNVYPYASSGDFSTTSFDVANGIIQAVNGGAKIINLSLGSPDDSDFLRSIVQQVSRLNIALIAAAGNEPVTTPFYPAAYPGVQAVTAIDQGQLAPYASRGSFVSLAAPGTSIVPFGNMAFGVEGTSVSSAFTSGLAAGYLELNGGTIGQMQNFLSRNFGIRIVPGK
ncbi:MAG TPA: S8 family serine peptidase [Candidatus Limnocylindrales bacterium]|nr:S8 family serine peptidase [Candidatus Limnocylindrales bacterium]